VPADAGILECVVNVSEGRDPSVVAAIAEAGGDHVLDVHTDAGHHRSVVTLGGPATEEAVRSVARRTVELLDIGGHLGAHPRLGALDVVPFVPLGPTGHPVLDSIGLEEAVRARDRFARWCAEQLAVPCFSYGPERSLPEVRRKAFAELDPDFGPARPHPSAGACAVGARFVLVAYNLWLSTADVAVATEIARSIRGPLLRALGLSVGECAQVSCNLVEPFELGPAQVHDTVDKLARAAGTSIARSELVGLAPAAVLEAVPHERWRSLDLALERSIEWRLANAGRSSPTIEP
jgi:glutamate formiminotransferase / 5-formyltetrahydrofolate cyclo-ligase